MNHFVLLGVQRAKIMEELRPELEEIRKAAAGAGTDSQKLINELYKMIRPFPRRTGP